MMFTRGLLSASLLLLLLGLGSCSAEQPYLSGQVKLHDGWKNKIYLIQPTHFNEIAGNYLGTLVDSATIHQDGKFSFNDFLPVEEESIFILAVQKEESRFPKYLSDEDPNDANYMPVVFSPDAHYSFSADVTNFQTSFSLKNPTEANRAIASLRDIRLKAYNQLKDDLALDTHDEEFIIEREAAHQRYTQELRDFANKTNDFFAAIIAIRWVSPTGDFERNPEFLLAQCEKWTQDNPGHQFTTELCALADKNQLPVVIGDIIPNFRLPMASGEETPLHNLLGQQVTILDIWASWCAPCRKENRNVLAPLYSSYQKQGLNIIGYALDSGAGPWMAAIEKDSAIWHHASHLQGDDSPFMEALRISTIPANYILDANGKILAKNLHGEELMAFIRTHFE